MYIRKLTGEDLVLNQKVIMSFVMSGSTIRLSYVISHSMESILMKVWGGP